MKKNKIVFLGTPQFAAPVLKKLIDDKNNEVMLVITQPDRPVGRSGMVTPPPVKTVAQQVGLTIMQPDDVNGDDVVDMIKSAEPDFIVVVAYGQILKGDILELAKKEILNVHASLLPKYRGASPIQSAILSGDDETGVSVMGVRRKMDAGPVYSHKKVSIDDKNFLQLSKQLADAGAKAVLEVIKKFDSCNAKEQDDKKVSYCKKVSRDDGEVSFSEMDASEIIRRFHAFYGWPGIFTYWNGKRLILSEVEASDVECTNEIGVVSEVDGHAYVMTKNGSVELKVVKLEGKREMTISEFLKGRDDFVGSVLGPCSHYGNRQ